MVMEDLILCCTNCKQDKPLFKDFNPDKGLEKCSECHKKCGCGTLMRFGYFDKDKSCDPKACSKCKKPEMVNLYNNKYQGVYFEAKIKQLGGIVIGQFINRYTTVLCKCKNGHLCNAMPRSITEGYNMCIICSGKSLTQAMLTFYSNVEQLGGKIIGEYKTNDTPVDCICKNGHECNPRPVSLVSGHGMCRVCVNSDNETARKNFYIRIKELGGIVLGEYTLQNNRVKCICPKGHECMVEPARVQQGRGMCNRCCRSHGEILTHRILQKMDRLTDLIIEDRPSFLNKLRYDFKVYDTESKNNVYIEFHGEQHNQYTLQFHGTNIEKFHNGRQRDLVKIEAIKRLEGLNKLIIIDHTYLNRAEGELYDYIIKCLDSPEVICYESTYHSWCSDLPTEESLIKYLIY